MRRKMIFLLAVLLSFALWACDSGEVSQNAEYPEEKGYIANNLDQFRSDWSQAASNDQALTDGLHPNNTEIFSPSIKIPVLETEDFVFSHVAANDYNFRYYYVPADESADMISFDGSTGIIVCVSREENSFSAVMAQHGLTPNDGKAYDTQRNIWYLDSNGKNIYIAFPPQIIIEDPAQIEAYFTFTDFNPNDTNVETE